MNPFLKRDKSLHFVEITLGTLLFWMQILILTALLRRRLLVFTVLWIFSQRERLQVAGMCGVFSFLCNLCCFNVSLQGLCVCSRAHSTHLCNITRMLWMLEAASSPQRWESEIISPSFLRPSTDVLVFSRFKPPPLNMDFINWCCSAYCHSR